MRSNKIIYDSIKFSVERRDFSLKFKNKMIIISLIIALLFIVSAVSAADGEVQAISAHNSTDDVVSTVNDDDLGMTDDGEILAETDDGSFAALNSKIGSAPAGSTVYLVNDYEYSSTDTITTGIFIDKNLIIDGQGHKIDAKGQSRIFDCSPYDVVDVTLKNITFLNGNAEYGGALYWYPDGGESNIINCTFIGNRATGQYYSGAIYEEEGISNIINSTFINNYDSKGGLYLSSTKVINSIFLNNGETTMCGPNIEADYNWFGNTIDNYNTAPSVRTSNAVNNWYVLNLDINHDSEQATISLNNLYENGVLTTDDCYALPKINMKVTGSGINLDTTVNLNVGVATVGYDSSDKYSITVGYNGVELTKSYVPSFKTLNDLINGEGNTFSLEQDYEFVSAKDSVFTNGIEINKDVSIDGQGHYIDAKYLKNIFYFDDLSKNLTLKNIIFKNAIGTNGAAVYFNGNKIEIINCTFINNKATAQGDAVYVVNAKGENKIIGSKFVNNTGSDSALYINLDSANAKFNITNSIFINNTAQNIVKGNGNIIADYNWWGNNASNYNIAMTKTEGISVNNWLFLNITVDEKNSIATISLNNIFENNAASFYDDYALPDFTLIVKKLSLNAKDDIVLGENGQSELGYVLTDFTGYLTVSYFDIESTKEIDFYDDCSFTSLKQIISFYSNGDVIPLNNDYTYNATKDKMTNGILINKLITINGNGHKIDAQNYSRFFYINDNTPDIILNNITFLNGKSSQSGGVIYSNYYSDFDITNCIFINNTAANGGAVFSYYTDINFINCTFINNSASSKGGSLMTYCCDFSLFNCTFINNSASDTAVLYNDGYYSSGVNIINSTFKDNRANTGYIVYCSDTALFNIENSSFIHNNVGSSIVYGKVSTGLKIINSNFSENTANQVIYDGYTSGRIDKCIFMNNSINYVVYYDSEAFSGDIQNSIFLETPNYYIIYGYTSSMNTVTADNNWFGNNATNYNQKPNVPNSLTLNNWYYLDIDASKNYALISLKLTDGTQDIDNNPTLPNINLTIENENLTVVNEVTLNSGKAIVPYALNGENGLITAKQTNTQMSKEIKLGDFDLLQQLVNENDVVELTRNYTYDLNFDDITEGIIINKPNLIISGNGFTIDAKGKSRFFKISESGVTINNVTLINGKADDEGGAIYCSGDDCTITSSIFANNTATKGSAVYLTGNNGKINDCIFVNNHGDNDINAPNDLNAEYNWFGNNASNYNINIAKVEGFTLNNWYFLNMTLMPSSANIDLNNVYVVLDQTNITNDNCALPNVNFTLTGENVTVQNNIIINKQGNVPITPLYKDLSLTASFETASYTVNNTLQGDFAILQRLINDAGAEGIVNLDRNYTYIVGADTITDGIAISYRNVTINGNGHTINALGKSSIFKVGANAHNLTINNVTFINALGSSAGAIYWGGAKDGNIINSRFINNTGTNAGGAIYFSGGNISIINSTFKDNSASQDGGAFYLWDGANVLIHNSTFINNTAQKGGVINIFSGLMSINKSDFINNTASTTSSLEVMGGVIFCGAFSEKVDIINSNFINNGAESVSGKSNGGVIYIGYGIMNIANSTFNRNYVTSSSGTTYGSVFHWNNNAKGEITNSSFLNNHGKSSYSAVIYGTGTNSKLNVTNSIFLNNTYGSSNILKVMHRYSGGTFNFTDCWFGNIREDSGSDMGMTSGTGVTINNRLTLSSDHDEYMVVGKDRNVRFVFEYVVDGKKLFYDASKLPKINLTLSSVNGTINKNSASMDEDIAFNASEFGHDIASIAAKYNGIEYTELLSAKAQAVITVEPITVHVGESVSVNVIEKLPQDADLHYWCAGDTQEDEFILVSANGYVKGKGEGTTTLYVKYNGNDDYAPETVEVPVTVIKYNTELVTLIDSNPVDSIVVDWGGEPQSIQVGILSDDPDPDYTGVSFNFKSNDTNVAKFSRNPNLITFGVAGTANITFFTAGNERYYGSEKNITVTVRKVESSVTVPSVEVIYGSTNTTTLTADGATGFTAALYDGTDEIAGVVSVDGNVVTINAGNLDVGTYTLSVTTLPDENHTSVTGTANAVVSRAGSDVTVPASATVIYASSVDVIVSIPDGGNASGVTAKLYNGDDEVVGVVSVDGLKITVDAAALNVGTYALNVTTVTDANHASVTKEVSVTVDPAGSDVTVPVSSSVVYDGSVTVVASDLVNASGVTAALYDGDVKVKDLTVDAGVNVVVDATDVDVGAYTLKVTTVPVDGNHESVTKEVSVDVNSAGSDVSVPVSSSVVYGSSVDVIVSIPDGGNASGVTAKLYNGDDEVVGVVSVDGLKITVDAAALNVGTYALNVTTVTDANHASVTKEVSVTVDPAGSDVTVPVSSSVVYDGSVTVEVSDLVNASGVTAALYDGDVKVKDLTVDAGVNVVVDATDVDVGAYTLKVTTVPVDGNHESVTKEVSVDVNSAGSDVSVPVSSSVVYGSSVDVIVSIPDGGNASGVTAKLYNGDDEVVGVVSVDGLKITVDAAALNVGTYALNVTTVTDANHASVTKEVSVTVDPAGSDVSVPVSSSVVYDGSVSVVVSGLVNASGVAAALYDGDVKVKDLTVDAGVNVVVDATGVDVGAYTLKVTTVPVDGNHESVTKEVSVDVNSAGSDVSVPVSSSVVYGSSVDVIVSIPDGGNASGVTAKLYNGDDEVVGVVSVDGLKITVDAAALNVGTYALNVTTVTDANHASVTKEVSVTVDPAGSDVSVPVSSSVVYDGSVSVVVSGLVNASGVAAALYDGDNKIKDLTVNDGVKVVVDATGVDVGNYTLKVTTIPVDGNHESTTKEGSVVVNPAGSDVSVPVSSSVVYGSSVDVTVSIPDGGNASGVTAKLYNGDVEVAGVVSVDDLKITVNGSDLDVGTYTLNVTTVTDANHASVTKEVRVTVTPAGSDVTVPDSANVNYTDSVDVVVSDLVNASGVTAKLYLGTNEITNIVSVNDLTITVNASALDVGDYTLKVGTIPIDDNHESVIRECTITVNKIDSLVYFLPNEIHFAYEDEGSTVATCTGCTIDEVNVTVLNHPEAIIKVEGGKITVSGLAEGEYIMKVITTPDNNHKSVEKTVKVNVSGISPKMSLQITNITVGENEVVFITMDTDAKGIVNITILKGTEIIDSKNITINNRYNKTVFTGLKVGNYEITAHYYGSQNYNDVIIPDIFFVHPIYNFEFEAFVNDTTCGNKTNATVTLSADASGSIQIGDTVQTIENPVTVIELPIQNVAGKNNVTVKYIPDANSKYGAQELIVYYNVAKKSTEITIGDISGVKVGDDVEIIASAYEGADIALYVDGIKLDSRTIEGVTAGSHTIIASVAETDQYLSASANKTFTVAKHDVDVSVGGTPTKIGEKSTITVNANVAEGIVIVNVNGTEYSVDLAQNNTIEVAMTNVGSVPLTARYVENHKYNAKDADASTIEVANKTASGIVIEIPNEIKVGEEIVINVTTPNNATLTVTINDIPQTVSDGKIAFTPTAAGIYSVEARTAETADYFGGVVFKSFEATKNAAEIKVEEIAPKKVGDDVLINVSTNSDGIITVLVDRVPQQLDENNTVTIMATAGTHEIILSVNETGKYLSATKTVTYEVAKHDVSISVNATPTRVGEKSTITVDVNVTEGIVAVNINGAEYSLNLSENNTFEIVMPEVGSVPLTARYIENDMYNAANADATTIEVTNKSSSNIVIQVPDGIKVGEEITINVSTPNNETLTVTINDETQTVSDGKIAFTPTAAGIYSVEARTAETADYFGGVVFKSFEATKNAAEIKVEEIAPKKVGDDVLINVSTNSDGIITVLVDREVQVLDENNTVTIRATSGTHEIIVSVNETGKYLPATKTVSYEVAKYDVIISVSATPTKVGEKSTITVDVNVIEGIVAVNINGAEYSLNLSENNTFEIVMPEVGSVPLTARYIENDMYNAADADATTIEVTNKSSSNILIEVPDDIKVGEEITINVTTPNNETLTVTINDVPQTVSDGKITFTPAEAGVYNIVALTNETADTFGEVRFASFEVTKKAAEITISDITGKKVGDDVEINATAYEGADIVLYVDGVKLDSNVLENVSAGKHTIVASVAETDEYLSASANMTFTVVKHDVSISVSGLPTTVGEKSTVTVDANVTEGMVLINVGGSEYSLDLAKNNTLEVLMTQAGFVTVTASYLENDKYNARNSTATNIPVSTKKDSAIVIEIPDDIKVASEITINVTADNSESLTVTINDVKQTIVEGKIKFMPTEAGLYIIRASTNETKEYFGDVKFATFEAVKNPAEVTIAEITPKMVDDDVVVEVSSYDGADIVVYIDGVKQTLTDGKVTVRATAGTHTVTASVAETGEYLSASANRTFEVSKYDVEINVSATSVNVGEKSTVTVNTNATEGIVLININGTEYSLNLTNANTLEVLMNAPGTALLTAKYVENYKYNAKEADPASIEVTQKEQSSIIIEVNDVCIVGEEITVNVTTNGDNLTVNVIFNGETVKTSNASFTFTPQRDGVYTVIAKTTENDTVYGGENATSFAALNRTKESASITVSPISDAKVGDEITFTVTAIGGGDAIVKINGETVNATDGVYRYTPEKGGLSILTVETPENERYSKGFNVTTFNVDKKESSINITIDGIIEVGKDVEVSIVSYDGADIAVYVDGVQKTLADGKITVKATAGSHIILASVAENDQYLASSANRTFTVDKKEANVTIAVEGILEVEKNIRLNIQSYEGADIVVYMDGIALDDWDVPFKATAGDHLVLAIVAENDEYLSASANVTFTIAKKPSSVYVSGSTVYVGEKSLIEVEITKGATGIVIVNVNGTEYSLNVSQNRSLGVVLDKAGLYNISARYMGDDRFLSSESEINTIFAMDKKDSKIEIEAVDEAYAGDDVVVKVTSSSDAGLEVYLDGVRQSLEDGRFTISNITAGSHMIEVTSPETSEYKYNSTRKFINAVKKQSEISIEMPEAANVGDVIEINVTSYDGADITVLIDGVKQTLADCKITVNATAGTHTVIASVAENDKYMASALNRTFAVSKLSSAIAVSATNVTIGQATLITIETNMSEGIVVVKLNGTELAVDLAKSKTASIVLDAPGDYELSATYQENDKYIESSALPSTVRISEKQSSTVDVEIPEIQAGENETVTVSVPNATGEVHIIIDGNDNIVPLDENGTASYTVPEMGAGAHSIVVVYPGDETHGSKVVSKTLTVEKQTSQANVTAPGEVKAGENATVTVEIPGATGNVSVIVDGKEHIIPLDENGTVNYTIADVGPGDHSVVVIYPGDDTHTAAHASSSFNVPAEPVVVKLATEFTEIVVNANVITAVLKDIDGNAVVNATVSYEIGGDVANTTTDANGSFTVYGVANSKVTISYVGNDSLLATNTSLVLENVVEPKLGSQFNVTEGISIKTYAVDLKAGEIGCVEYFKLTDSNGRPIANATIKFAYKSVILNRTTDENGIVYLGINTYVAQTALCAMSYVGDEKYNATFVAFSFDIQLKPITISASSKTYKSTVKTKKYTVTLKTEKCNSRDGKVYLSSGKKVTIKINGKTYTAKTNSKGQATFKITKLTQKGKYIALIKFDGDKTYESASKKVKITIK